MLIIVEPFEGTGAMLRVSSVQQGGDPMKNGKYPTDDTLERYRQATNDLTEEGENHVTPKPAMPRDRAEGDDDRDPSDIATG